MDSLSKDWIGAGKKTITSSKRALVDASIKARTQQFVTLKSLFSISKSLKVLDVGTTSDETLKDSNLFLRLYPFPYRLTTATVEDEKKLQEMYPKIKVVKVYPKKKLPFGDGEFDIVTAWATLEHVGGYKDQEFFINELLRVGKEVFLTTPYRACPYEPHSGLWFLHWLPLEVFRAICGRVGQKFWANEDHLNPLYIKDVRAMKTSRKLRTRVFRLFGWLPSHLIIHT